MKEENIIQYLIFPSNQKSAGLEKGSFITLGSPVARIVNIKKLKAEFQLGEMLIWVARKS